MLHSFLVSEEENVDGGGYGRKKTEVEHGLVHFPTPSLERRSCAYCPQMYPGVMVGR